MSSPQKQTPDRDKLLQLVGRFSDQRVVIVGDAIADRFLYGAISRVSREAPVLILKHDFTETVPGGAANCAMNLASLGAKVSLISAVGNDEPGSELQAKLAAAGVDLRGMHRSESLKTTTKVRIFAGHAHSNKQQVIRIDYESEMRPDKELRQALNMELSAAIARADALIISDYNYGLVDSETVELVRKATQSKSIPVLVDSRFSLSRFKGFTAATPNEDEVEHLISEPIGTTTELEAAGSRLKEQLEYRALLITRGGQGMMLLDDNSPPLHIKAVGAQQPVDVTGAGDTVIATFALSLASGGTFSDAAHLANFAGGLVVMKRGTASISASELKRSILNFEGE